MRCTRRFLCLALLLSWAAGAQNKLPVKRVVLFKNGVGYFEHVGPVHGDESVTIAFTSGQLNDVLKSLTVLDLNGGRIAGVAYGSSAPIDRQLGDLRLPIGEKATLADFLSALRGTKLEIRNGASTITGRLLSIELFGMRFGLDRMRRLMTALGHPERSFRSIHVVGTNGKSSTTRMIAAILAGHGHFVGVTMSVLQNQDGWWGEGDDMFFVDGAKQASINGTGSEDYFLGAWDFGDRPFSYALFGAPVKGEELAGGRSSTYRFHLDSPIPFTKSLRATIEHGHANHRSDNFFSVAYWYQNEPHAAFPPLPPVERRIPRIYSVGGPGNVAKPSSN